MVALLKMTAIQKAFNGVPALSGASIEIERGEVHALIGQNAAGKSTMIKVLTGVYRRDGGTVLFNGADSVLTTPREAQAAGIATIYQELNLVPLRSVTENVMMEYEPKRLGIFINWAEAHRRTRVILHRFGIDIDVKMPLGSYSTAIQQLVAIARAVSLDANLVIMDEPTSSLDVYLVSGGCAGLAGVILASGFGAGQPLEGIAWELSAIASVVVGGTLLTGGLGSIPATVAGALLLGLVFNILNFENGRGTISFSAYWLMVIRGGFLFAVILFQTRMTKGQKSKKGNV